MLDVLHNCSLLLWNSHYRNLINFQWIITSHLHFFLLLITDVKWECCFMLTEGERVCEGQDCDSAYFGSTSEGFITRVVFLDNNRISEVLVLVRVLWQGQSWPKSSWCGWQFLYFKPIKWQQGKNTHAAHCTGRGRELHASTWINRIRRSLPPLVVKCAYHMSVWTLDGLSRHLSFCK